MTKPANDNRDSAANDNSIVRPSSFHSLDLLDAIDWWREDAVLTGAVPEREEGAFPYLPPKWTFQSA